MNASRLILTFACFAALSTASMAATITYEATFSGVQHQFGGANNFTRTFFTLSGPPPS
jgi:hypothetical protein